MTITPMFSKNMPRIFSDWMIPWEYQSSASPSCGYNILKKNEDEYEVSVLTAGFSKDEVKVTVSQGQLKVSAAHSEDSKENQGQYLHQSFNLKRNIQHDFDLGDNVEVKKADIKNGVLTVALKRVIPEDSRPLEIPIN